MDTFEDFKHNGTGSLHQELAYYLRGKIEGGELRPGEALPPLRTLSKLLDVNFFSVKLATDVLVDWGLLNKQQGRGMFVALPGSQISQIGLYSCPRYIPNRDLSFYTLLQNLVCGELKRRNFFYTVLDDRESVRQAVSTNRIQGLIGIYIDDLDKQWFQKLPVKKVNMMRNLMFDFGSVARFLEERKCRRVAALVPAAFPRPGQSFLITGLKACGVKIMPKHIRAVEQDEVNARDWAEIGYETVRDFLASPSRPDALVVYPDNAVLGAIQAIFESGIRVPEELSLVFHRNVELSYFCALDAFYIDTRIADVAAQLVQSILEK